MKKTFTAFSVAAAILGSCDLAEKNPAYEKLTQFTQIEDITLAGGETAAEISAFDPHTQRLFVVNAVKSAIDIVDMRDPFHLVFEREILVTPYGSNVNSVAVKNGVLAAAIESNPKTDPGKVVVWDTRSLSVLAEVSVGALPDMVAFSPNGKYIVSANEGEPSEDYSIDPEGTISVIRVPGFSVRTLDFRSFTSQASDLKAKGFRTPGPAGTPLSRDVEPEYVAVSHDSRTAWVTLQENNAVARVDLHSARIETILPLGFKDHSIPGNEIDPSDRDNVIELRNAPVKGLYLPDGVSSFRARGLDYFITANEGDARIRPTDDDALPPLEEGDLFNEEARINNILLDPVKFPHAADLQKNTSLGRLKITNTMGDTDLDGDFDELYSFGSRSFTIRDGSNGRIVFDSGADLESFLFTQAWGAYDDGRSDDKGAEPESVATGQVGSRTLAFIGLERADAVVVVDVTHPESPIFWQVLKTGDAPEGVLFIPAHESPNRKSLLVTSCEGDGSVQVFQLSAQENAF